MPNSKNKQVFICKNCKADYSKWQGKCSQCNEWNTIIENEIPLSQTQNRIFSLTELLTIDSPHEEPEKIEKIQEKAIPKIITFDEELNRVLGGGIVKGSTTLIGGDPGIGKSTLLLQLALSFQDQKGLYVSGEETKHQIKLRANRLKIASPNCYIMHATNLLQIIEQIKKLTPDFVIIDSIQTTYLPHLDLSLTSINQIKACTLVCNQVAKKLSIPILLIGHINKEGNLAGPKLLEHMVDTVLQFEGDKNFMYRILRSIKNRFGSVPELGVYEMKITGLRSIKNPSNILLSENLEIVSGISIAPSLESNQVLMIEVQALVSNTTYSIPQRNAIGFDIKKLNILLAILEKKGKLFLNKKDVFIKIAGGIKVNDPGLDLAVCMAIFSSLYDKNIKSYNCFIAEIDLSGQLRTVYNIEKRIQEAIKLGFKKIYLAKSYSKELNSSKFNQQIGIEYIGSIQEMITISAAV